jgi:hypothetical protein
MSKRTYVNARPPIPSNMIEVPTCAYCKKARTRNFESRYVGGLEHDDNGVQVNANYEYTGRVTWGRAWYANNRFCSLGCCERFAAAAFTAGYRMKS